MAPKTDDFFKLINTRFWVVRPRDLGRQRDGIGHSNLGSLIGMEIGNSKSPSATSSTLQTPPVVTGNAPGRFFVLKTSDLGSLDLGTPLFFRRLQVGRVASYKLDKDGKFFTLQVFVRAPYDQYVTANTRFWQASGIDVSLSASGLGVQTQSLLSILIGGVAFQSPATDGVLPAAAADTVFVLYSDRAKAFEPAARSPQTYKLIFKESVRGLAPGAPVEFRGIPIGEVADIRAQIDLKTFEFSVPVTIRLDPQRLGVRVIEGRPTSGADLERMRRRLIDALIAHGARAQLRTGNLLTGSVFVAIDFFPGAPPAMLELVADSGAAADRSGAAPSDRDQGHGFHQQAGQDAPPADRR